MATKKNPIEAVDTPAPVGFFLAFHANVWYNK